MAVGKNTTWKKGKLGLLGRITSWEEGKGTENLGKKKDFKNGGEKKKVVGNFIHSCCCIPEPVPKKRETSGTMGAIRATEGWEGGGCGRLGPNPAMVQPHLVGGGSIYSPPPVPDLSTLVQGYVFIKKIVSPPLYINDISFPHF